MKERMHPMYEWRYYSLVVDGEIVAGSVDKLIAEKWLNQQLEKGNDTAFIVENLEKNDTCIFI